MPITDPQLKSNDSGVSAIKTIFNIFEKNISRKYIEEKLPLEQKGARIEDLKDFFNANGFISQFQLLNFNAVEGNESEIDAQLPFILQIKHKSSSRFVIVKERKRSKFLIFDPSKGSQYWLASKKLKTKRFTISTTGI